MSTTLNVHIIKKYLHSNNYTSLAKYMGTWAYPSWHIKLMFIIETRLQTSMLILLATQVVTTKNWKQPTVHQLINRQIQCIMFMMECCWDIKRNGTGWILKTLSWMKAPRHKSLHITWFHLYEISRGGKSYFDRCWVNTWLPTTRDEGWPGDHWPEGMYRLGMDCNSLLISLWQQLLLLWLLLVLWLMHAHTDVR